MKWFRLYSEILDDPNVMKLTETMRWRYVALMAVANREEKRGQLPSNTTIGFYLRLNPLEVESTLKELHKRKLLRRKHGNFIIKNFLERQFESDISTDRVKRYRDKREEAGLPRSSGKIYNLTKDIFARDDNQCVYCGTSEKLCIDHILPIVQGGTDDPLNLATACKGCNSGKSGRTPEQARYQIKSDIVRANYQTYLSRLQKEPVTVTVTPPDTKNKVQTLEEEKEGEEKEEASPLFEDYPVMKFWAVFINKDVTALLPQELPSEKDKHLIREALKKYDYDYLVPFVKEMHRQGKQEKLRFFLDGDFRMYDATDRINGNGNQNYLYACSKHPRMTTKGPKDLVMLCRVNGCHKPLEIQ